MTEPQIPAPIPPEPQPVQDYSRPGFGYSRPDPAGARGWYVPPSSGRGSRSVRQKVGAVLTVLGAILFALPFLGTFYSVFRVTTAMSDVGTSDFSVANALLHLPSLFVVGFVGFALVFVGQLLKKP